MQPTPWDPEGVDVVLDPEGNPSDESATGDLDLAAAYRTMVSARLMDHRVSRMGLPMWAPAAGEEAAACVLGMTLHADDWVYPGVRDLAVAVARGMAYDEIVAQLRGTNDVGARATPGRISSLQHRIATATDALGMHLPLAAGQAHGQKLTSRGSVTVAICGEGTATTGAFHESLALAVTCDLPLVVVCKSQLWPEGAPAEAGVMGESVSERARTGGLWVRRVDGADVISVNAALSQAISRARDGRGPGLVEVIVTHLTHNPPAHRDPIERLRRYLDATGTWTQTMQDVIEADVLGRIDKAIAAATEAAS